MLVNEKYQKFFLWVLLFLSFLAFRISSLGIPLKRDQASYGYVAQQIISGQNLYKEVFDHKPPLIYYIYILSNWISKDPYNTIPLEIIVLTSSFISTVLIGLITKKCFGKEYMFIAMFLFNSFHTHPILTPFYANTEVFMVMTMLICIFIYIYFKNSKFIFVKWFIYGFFVSTTLLFKQIAIFPLALLTLTWLYEQSHKEKNFFLPFFYFILGNAFALATLLLPVVIHNKGVSFHEKLIFNLHYLNNFSLLNTILISMVLLIHWFPATTLLVWGSLTKIKKTPYGGYCFLYL